MIETMIKAPLIAIVLIVFISGLILGTLLGAYISEKANFMKLKDIKIQSKFKKPSSWKMQVRLQYFKRNGIFYVPIVVNDKGVLVDGYTSYLIAQQYNIKEVEVTRI